MVLFDIISRKEMISCMLCMDAPCSKACDLFNPGDAMRSIWFDNADVASLKLPEGNACMNCSAPCEGVCLSNSKVPIKNLMTKLAWDIRSKSEIELPTDEDNKTGTLIYSKPRVYKVVPLHGQDETEMLRLAACLEEHFPHSIANAVVEEARLRGIDHEEMHSKVEYIVAHGISSSVGDEKVVIGSYHFVFEDEGCTIDENDRPALKAIPLQYSALHQ